MKLTVSLVLAIVVLFCSCRKESIRGSGPVETITRVVPNFSQVAMGGDGEVLIEYGVAQTVTITGYQNLLPVYESNVVGNTLHLRFKPNQYNVRNNNIKTVITIPALNGMQLNGSGRMEAANFVNPELVAAVNGSGHLAILNSHFDKATFAINGSGDIKAASTLSNEAIAEIYGSGGIDIKVRDKLKASISGSGVINYWGSPASVDTQIAGSGKVNKK